jgi:hypothetical protein
VTVVALSFTSILATDVISLSAFYQELFELDGVPSLDSPHFRGLRSGRVIIGFSGPSAYELLNLPKPEGDEPGLRNFLTFDVANPDEVDALTTKAIAAGATLRWGPGETYYGAHQATLLDPEGNAFRINHLEVAELAEPG